MSSDLMNLNQIRSQSTKDNEGPDTDYHLPLIANTSPNTDQRSSFQDSRFNMLFLKQSPQQEKEK